MTEGRAIVDAHQHFWDLTPGNHPWLCEAPPIPSRHGDYEAIRHDYLPEHYRADASGYRVLGTVYVETEWNPADPLGEVRWVHALAAREGMPGAVVAQAWLDRDDASATLAALAEFPLVRSVRHKPSIFHSRHAPPPFPRGSMSDPCFRRGFAALEPLGLAFDLQVVHWHLPEAAELARAFPGTTIIVNHTGLPVGGSRAELELWRADLAVLAREPNVALKISGLGDRGRPWTATAHRRVVLDAIELLGVERCMFASNFPVERLYVDFATMFAGFESIVSDLTENEQHQLFAGNAVRYYQLENEVA